MDIVERLQRANPGFQHDGTIHHTLGQAADEIERLRLEVAEMRPTYLLACQAGSVFGPEARWVCGLCMGARASSVSRTTIEVELLHESGERQTVQRVCPRCGGSGLEPGEELPQMPGLGAGDQVEEVEAYADGTGATVSVRKSDGRLTRHAVTLEQGREMGARLCEVEGEES